MKRVLLVEDDSNIVELLSIHLTDLECDITSRTDGYKGLTTALNEPFDLIILDVMLPKVDGLDICKEIRANRINTPILMLTAKSEEIDKVLGLESGADDYLTKPFGVREFIARVKAIFRRAKMSTTKENTTKRFIASGDLFIDVEKRKVTIKDNRIELSPKEFELLVLLSSHPGKSYARTQILNLVWGYEFNGYEHTVNSHINRLRSKIEPDISKPTYILTSWGVGYRFTED